MQRTPPPRYRPPLKRPQTVDDTAGAFSGRCPYLGTAADPGTALAFASDANQCYRTRLPVPISIVHQQSYCLTSDFAQCPVYQQNLKYGEVAPLVTAPPSWGIAEEELVTNVVIGPSRQQDSRSPVLPIVILLVLLAGGFWLWRGVLSQPDNRAQQSQHDLAIGETTPLPEVLPQDSGEGQLGLAIVAVSPTATSTPTSAPVSESTPEVSGNGISLPILPTEASVVPDGDVVSAAGCTSPEWWVPYVVLNTDALPELAQMRGLSVTEVLQGNCLADAELVAGQIILLPPLAIVISLSPTSRAVPTRASGSAAVVVTPTAVPSTATPLPANSTPTAFATDAPDDPPQTLPTRAPAQPTALPTTPPRSTQTATPPALEPTATDEPARPTVTPPSVIPSSTPPPTPTFERPTQTPPPPGP